MSTSDREPSPASRDVYPSDRKMVLAGVVGSTAYGLTTTTSDKDRLGVYVASRRDVLGLDGHAAVTNTVTSTDPDIAIHEVGKFLALCLKANPTVTELLWLDTYDVCNDVGDTLVGLRRSLLSGRQVRASYGGYATAQARRLVSRNERGANGFAAGGVDRVAKHARHCMRLLLQGRTLLTTGELVVNVACRRDELFAVGELAVSDPGAFHARFEAELAALDALGDGVLPREPDRDAVNDALINLRERFA